MTAGLALPAFAGYGIELEYMIVDRQSLAVRPLADRLLRAFAGRDAAEVVRGTLGWSNELVRHVVEVKNLVPTAALVDLPARIHDEIRAANDALANLDARLMPTAMHPWMNPATETVLWEDAGEIYRTYDRIYDCRGHGWSNLQSMHVNLPFAGDAEFERLHAAIRLVLPLVPALAASSPFEEGTTKGFLDRRLENYSTICALTPSVSGRVIPDTAHSRADYEARVLEPMYAEIAPLDPAGVLRHEWLNSRGAIPRFDRDAIEIRLVDVQECPQADLAIAAVIVATVKALYGETFSSLAEQRAVATEALYDVLRETMRDADHAFVDHAPYLRSLGVRGNALRAVDVWGELVDAGGGESAWWHRAIELILTQGPLARRILRTAGGDADRDRLRAVYGELCDCLAHGRMFA